MQVVKEAWVGGRLDASEQVVRWSGVDAGAMCGLKGMVDAGSELLLARCGLRQYEATRRAASPMLWTGSIASLSSMSSRCDNKQSTRHSASGSEVRNQLRMQEMGGQEGRR